MKIKNISVKKIYEISNNYGSLSTIDLKEVPRNELVYVGFISKDGEEIDESISPEELKALDFSGKSFKYKVLRDDLLFEFRSKGIDC